MKKLILVLIITFSLIGCNNSGLINSREEKIQKSYGISSSSINFINDTNYIIKQDNKYFHIKFEGGTTRIYHVRELTFK